MKKQATKRRESRYEAYLAAVEQIHGPAPENPYKAARLHAALTLVQVSGAVGVSKLALIRLEQGIPVTPIDSVTLFFLDARNDLNYSDLVNKYEEFQSAMRLRHSRLFGNVPSVKTFADHVEIHPFQQLLDKWTNPRSGDILGTLNPTEFAKLLCFPQSVGDHFLSKVHRQQSVPKQLLSVLRDAGYTKDELTCLERAYVNHRNFVLHGKAPVTSEYLAPVPVSGKGSRRPIETAKTGAGLLDAIKKELL